MRRHGQYIDSGSNSYLSAQMERMPEQRSEHKSSHYQGHLEAFTPERDPYGSLKSEGQWRWERDGSKASNSLATQIFSDGRQGPDGSRTYFQSQMPDPKLSMEKQVTDLRSQSHKEDIKASYEENLLSQTFDGLEKKFLDDLLKLAKEQSDAEDGENARHREKMNAINTQYQDQLAALQLRHASRRDELLRKESHARRQLYQQVMMDYYPNSSVEAGDAISPVNACVYSSVVGSAAVGGEAHRAYTSEHFDPYRERARFSGSARDHGFEHRGSYPGGRVYNTSSRYL